MNRIHLIGILSDRFIKMQGKANKRLYSGDVLVMRDSGDEDMVPVVAEESLVLSCELEGADVVEVTGEVKTTNEGGRLHVYVYADEITKHDIEDLTFENSVEIDGYVCRKPNLRTSPKGRELSDFILAVEDTGRNNYVPCIVWGMNARRTYMLNVGDKVKITGRFQSRDYLKKTEAGFERRTVYEVSATKLFESV